MSTKNFSNLTATQRAELAGRVKEVRLRLGLTQQEVANEAGVTRQSIGSIESGEKIPQEKTLVRVLEVLGITPKPAEFTKETSKWLAIVGGIMDALPSDRKARAGQAAVEAVTAELVDASSVSGMSHDDLHNIDLSQGDVELAATTDTSAVQEQAHPNYEEEPQDEGI